MDLSKRQGKTPGTASTLRSVGPLAHGGGAKLERCNRRAQRDTQRPGRMAESRIRREYAGQAVLKRVGTQLRRSEDHHLQLTHRFITALIPFKDWDAIHQGAEKSTDWKTCPLLATLHDLSKSSEQRRGEAKTINPNQ